ETYTRATPNLWSTAAFDDALGLVYVPLGVATPDYWGAPRSKEADKYSNSVVALDIATGRPRWHFQAIHHDLWDYDLPPQPALVDVPDGHGSTIPALIQGTKTGQIFVLDRRDGTPILPITEKPVPQGGLPGDRTAPTQPYSAMPAIGAEPLDETKMWGITPVDQLWCRIQFKKLRYEGEFTPPMLGQPALMYPGYFGGMNWGSVSVDETRDLLIVNDMRIAIRTEALPRAQSDSLAQQLQTTPPKGYVDLAVMNGAPVAMLNHMFMSPLDVPCIAPPWGTMTAIDLKKKSIVWQVPMGTTRDTGPAGLKLHLPIPLGLPTLGGAVSTQTGLIFFAGTQDYYLRALDSNTGKELWKARLPVGSQASPMTYISKKSGRQFVVVVAGGTRLSKDKGDYVVAYALPNKATH
ncbi:MAG: PQQ-binding-like beta-propeller repeat protein, partial [Steroidobacteraceae bacterium]